MVGEWPMVPLGEVLRHRKEFIKIDDLQSYKRCRVQLHAQGVVLRDQVDGTAIRTKAQQVCRAGEFLVAEIDAKHGGYGLVSEELDGAIVSSHYFLFETDEVRLDRRFLGYYCRTPAFANQVAAQGSTNYAAIRPSHVLQYEIPLPPIGEQRRIVARIEDLAARFDEAARTALAMEQECQSLLAATYRQLATTAPRHRLGDVAPLARRPAKIELDGEYPGVSVRSFGKGTFHNPPLLGSEITWEKPHLVKSGDIVLSNIKAWEGAIAVAKPEDDGRYGSHRYLTYAPKDGVANATWVCFYLLSPEGLYHVGEASPGSADRNRTTSAKAVMEIPIPLPSYKQQLWFERLFHKVQAVRQLQAESARIREALLPSILNKAFNGKL